MSRIGFGAMQLPGPGVFGPPRNRDEAIAVLRIEKVNREKRGIVFRKVRDLKGTFPTQGKYFGDTFTHVIRESANDWLMFKPHNHMDADRLELQNQAILAWAVRSEAGPVRS